MVEGIRDEKKRGITNLTKDAETIKKFNEEALRAIRILKHRFYIVFESMDDEDVVSECWKKILSQNISYDESKSKFSSFVMMIVTSKLTDLARTAGGSTKVKNAISLDRTVSVGVDKVDSVPYENTVKNRKAEQDFNLIEIFSEVDELSSIFTEIPNLKKVLYLIGEGSTINEVIEDTGVDLNLLTVAKRVIRDIYRNRKEGKAVPMYEILYFESQKWDEKSFVDESRREYLLEFCKLIRDDNTGINLSKVVRMVLRDFSYKSIAKKLGIDEIILQRFVEKYECVLI